MKVVLITGGSRGIGKATVEQFLASGYKVVTTSTTGDIPIEHANLTSYKFNLGNEDDVEDLVDDLRKQNIAIDVLINNAWKTQKTEMIVNMETLKDTLFTNLVGTIDLTSKLFPLLNNNTVIINVSSEFGSLTEDWGCRVPSYRIAKAALNMYTRNFYACPEVKAKGMKVYSFDPGWVKTDMGGPDAEREPEEPAQELLALAESGNETGLFYRGLKVREW